MVVGDTWSGYRNFFNLNRWSTSKLRRESSQNISLGSHLVMLNDFQYPPPVTGVMLTRNGILSSEVYAGSDLNHEYFSLQWAPFYAGDGPDLNAGCFNTNCSTSGSARILNWTMWRSSQFSVRLADDRLAVVRLGLSIYHWNVRIETLTYLFDLRFDPEIGSSTLSWSQEGQYTCQSWATQPWRWRTYLFSGLWEWGW